MDSSSSTPGSPYRNEINALRERREALAKEIDKLREQTTQLDELKMREAKLVQELEGVDVRLREGGATKRALPLLDQVRVASPCKAEWNDMVGDDRVRFCLQCEKNVYNLSSMNKDDAETLLRERLGGELCVRFYQRADGTILTQDCPEGVKKKRRKKLALAIAGAGAMAAAALTTFRATTCRTGAVAGALAYQGEPMPLMGDVAPIPVPSAMPTEEVKGEAALPPEQPQHVMGRLKATPPPPPPDHVLKMGKRAK